MLCEYTTSLLIPLLILLVTAGTMDGIAMVLVVGGIYAVGVAVVIYVVGINGMHAEYYHTMYLLLYTWCYCLCSYLHTAHATTLLLCIALCCVL